MGLKALIEREKQALIEKYLEKIDRVIEDNEGDKEYLHSGVDDILVELLDELGYSVLTEKWKNLDKWYA